MQPENKMAFLNDLSDLVETQSKRIMCSDDLVITYQFGYFRMAGEVILNRRSFTHPGNSFSPY